MFALAGKYAIKLLEKFTLSGYSKHLLQQGTQSRMKKNFSGNLFLLLGALAYSFGMLLHPLYHHADSSSDEISPRVRIFQSAAGSCVHVSTDFFCPLCTGIFKAVDIPEPLPVISAPGSLENSFSAEILYTPVPHISHPPRGPPVVS